MIRLRRLAAFVILSIVSLAAVPLAAQEPARGGGLVVRVLTPRFRTVEEMLAVVQPLLSDEGSVLIQTRTKSLTVKDREGSVERIAQAVGAADVPPRTVALSVTLLRAGPGAGAGKAKGIPDAPYMNGIGERLRKLFSFESYTVLESLSFQGAEGSAAGFAMGKDYRLDFRLERSLDSSTFRLKDVVLSKQRGSGSRPGWTDLLRTSINVPSGQPFVLGVGRDESATGAIFLVFLASDATPGPGIGGIR